MRIPAYCEYVLLCLFVLGCPDNVVDGDDDVATDDDSTDAQTDDDSIPSDDDSTPSDDDSSGDDDTTPTDDFDGDGWTALGGDCDDTDPSVHPAAEEIPCDAVDNDCDGYGILSGVMLGGVEYATVPHALSAAVDGDTLYVCPGVHVGQLFIDDERRLSITSFSGNRDDTVLDGGGLETVVHIGEDNRVDLSHLTIRNGLAQPWLDGDYAGGGVMSFAVSTQIQDCVFVDNLAPQDSAGGAAFALYRWTALGSDPVEVEIRDSHFENNTAQGHAGRGGAVFTHTDQQALTVTLADSSFVGNGVGDGGEGGAVYVQATGLHGPNSSALQIDNCSLEGNWAGYAGGALLLHYWGSLQIVGSSFVDNRSDWEGGAISVHTPKLDPSIFEVSDSTFTDNSAFSEGGAWDISISDDESADLCLDTVTFTGNSTECCDGGAVYINGGGVLTLNSTDAVFDGNVAGSRGGGLYSSADGGMTIAMSGGAVTGNQALDVSGAFMFASDEPSLVDLVGVLVESNQNTTGNSGVLACSSNTTCTLDGCSVTSNAGGGAWISRVGNDSTLVSIDTDWGTGADDNTPHDVQIYEGDTYAAFGANETFTCTAELGCI